MSVMAILVYIYSDIFLGNNMWSGATYAGACCMGKVLTLK